MSFRRIVRLPGSPERARALFLDVEEWPRWLPGVTSARVEETDGDVRIVQLEQKVAGRRTRQRAEILATPDGFRQRRIAGEPRRWNLDWSFRPGAVEGETTVHLAIDHDFGMMSRMAPRRMVEGALERLFDDVLEAAATRLQQALVHESAALTGTGLPSRFHLRIEQRDGELHVFFDGRHYRAEPQG